MPGEPTKTTTHLGFLDVLRGVAILWVFLAHSVGMSYGSLLPQWGAGWLRDFAHARLPAVLFPLTYGFAGVAIFFVISGFCIHLSFLRGRPGDWRGFFIRRFFRIYPPYLAALVLFAFVFPKTHLTHGPGFEWGQLFSHVFLVHTSNPDWYFGINGSFWTIAVEAQLYLIYPVLVAVSARYGWGRALWLTGILEATLRVGVAVWEAHGGETASLVITGLPFFYWFSWAVGAALADAWVHGKKPLPFARWPLWPWVVLALLTPTVHYVAIFGFPCFAVATVIIVARRLDGREPASSWVPAVVTGHLQRLGVWSYACYLLHQPVINLLPYVPNKIHIPPALAIPEVDFAICLCLYPLVVGASALFRWYVERPSIAWGQWALRRERPAPSPGN